MKLKPGNVAWDELAAIVAAGSRLRAPVSRCGTRPALSARRVPGDGRKSKCGRTPFCDVAWSRSAVLWGATVPQCGRRCRGSARTLLPLWGTKLWFDETIGPRRVRGPAARLVVADEARTRRSAGDGRRGPDLDELFANVWTAIQPDVVVPLPDALAATARARHEFARRPGGAAGRPLGAAGRRLVAAHAAHAAAVQPAALRAAGKRSECLRGARRISFECTPASCWSTTFSRPARRAVRRPRCSRSRAPRRGRRGGRADASSLAN